MAISQLAGGASGFLGVSCRNCLWLIDVTLMLLGFIHLFADLRDLR